MAGLFLSVFVFVSVIVICVCVGGEVHFYYTWKEHSLIGTMPLLSSINISLKDYMV